MPDDPFDAIKGIVDPALQALSENRRKRNLQLERALRKAVNALERLEAAMKRDLGAGYAGVALAQATLTEIKGALGDE